MVTNEQLYLAIGIPALLNAALLGFVVAYINAKFSSVDLRFRSIEERLDHMQEMWRSELRRVEEVLDARLKHLESR